MRLTGGGRIKGGALTRLSSRAGGHVDLIMRCTQKEGRKGRGGCLCSDGGGGGDGALEALLT